MLLKKIIFSKKYNDHYATGVLNLLSYSISSGGRNSSELSAGADAQYYEGVVL